MAVSVIETEENLIIETPERVPLSFALASIGNRFLAATIDHLIQYSVIFLVAIVGFLIAGTSVGFEDSTEILDGMSKWGVAAIILIVFLLFTGYFIFFEWLWDGQTPGKRLLKLRVIREDGRPVTLWEIAARNLLRVFDAMPGFVLPIYSVGLIAVFLSNRDQRIGDIFAGTVVIRERLDEAPTFADTFSNPVSDAAFRRVQNPIGELHMDVKQLNISEIEVVETFLRRRWDLTEKQRAWVAWRIGVPIMLKLKPQYNMEDFSYEGFLEETLHRFHSVKAHID